MTLALIAAIVFLIAWGCQVGDSKIKQAEYKRKTRINLTLENEVFNSAAKEISELLDNENIPKGNIYAKLMSYFDKFGVAYMPFKANGMWGGIKRDYKYASREEMISAEDAECRLLEDACSNSCELTTMERIKFKPRGSPFTFSRCIYGTSDNDIYSELELVYYELILEVTKKRMHEIGYAFSKTGIRESDWQEREKEKREMAEIKKKYPYLFR